MGSRYTWPHPDTADIERGISNVAGRSEFTDDAGTVWHRRGGTVSRKHLRQQLADPAVTVLHEYLWSLVAVPPEQRESFWEQAEALMRESEHSTFETTEFKSEDRRYLLVVSESC